MPQDLSKFILKSLGGRGIEIWAGFGPIGSTEKKGHEQLLRVFFYAFRGIKMLNFFLTLQRTVWW